MCSHASHYCLFPGQDRIFYGTSVWITNQATQVALIKQGKQLFCYSMEDDFLNIKAAANPRGIMPVFGYIPLFISRVKPALDSKETVTDAKGNVLQIHEVDGLYYTLGEKPFCLFHRQEKLHDIGIRNFMMDFSFMPASRKLFKSTIYDFEKTQKTPDGIIFNHKAGLK